MKEVSEKVAAVVVTYNRKKLLKECIEALLNQDYKICDILVIDNASTDGTKEYIKKELQNKRVKYYNTGSNLGGAGGFNYGMKKAVELDYDYVWVMDDDCIVHSDSLTELLKADKKLKGNYGFLSSKVLWKDNSICVMNKQKKTFSTWLKDFDTNYQKIALASFVSMFLKVDTIQNYGLPIKDFFIWSDDWEFARRISRKEDCYFISKSIVTHKCNENIGASIALVDKDRLGRFKYMYRNDVVLYRGEGFKGKILLKMRLLLHKYRIIKSNKENKRERIKIIDDAIKEGKNFFPSIEYPYINGKTIRVLEFFGEPLNYGGQEKFIINMYKNFKAQNINYTFLTPFECTNTELKELVKSKSDKIIHADFKFNSKLRKNSIVKVAKKYVTDDYDVIHIHSGSIFTLFNVAKIAKKSGVKKVIVHSHCSGIENIKHRIIKYISDRDIEKYVDYFLGCSKVAAEYKFPKSIIENKNYDIINNGIEVDKFKFDPKTREKYRKDFKVTNKNVILNVGRYSYEKNQVFILEIFKKYLDINKNAFLIIVGGIDKEYKKINDLCKEMNIKDNVLLLTNRNDVSSIMQMSDVFILPSLYEGFPVTGIEAQAAGVPCLFSTNITSELNISKNYNVLDFSVGIDKWVSKLDELVKQKRLDTSEEVRKNGYSSEDCAKELENIYLK